MLYETWAYTDVDGAVRCGGFARREMYMGRL